MSFIYIDLIKKMTNVLISYIRAKVLQSSYPPSHPLQRHVQKKKNLPTISDGYTIKRK